MNITPNHSNNKRPRIMRGQLVASTDAKKLSCIKVLYIEHRYRELSFRRVKQVVIHLDEDQKEYN